MPTIKSGESEKEFVNRCIPILMDEGKEQKQAIAICFSMYKRRNEEEIKMNIIKKIDILLKDEIVTGDIETNIAKGKVDVLGNCPKGQYWCLKRKKCVPIGSEKQNESTLLGGGYIDSNTNIAGSGQTRIIGRRNGEITVLKTKRPDITTKFNKLLGIYTLPEDEITEKEQKKKKKKEKKGLKKKDKGPNSYGLMFDEQI